VKPKPAAHGPRYTALIRLLRTAEALWNASRRFFERWQISPSQFNLLNLLRDHPDGCTQIELSRQLIMHRSNVTGLIDRLEKRGLVRRADSATDRRAWRVALTPAGQRLVRGILPHYYAAAEEIWGDLPARRVEELSADLNRLEANAGRVGKVNPPLESPLVNRPRRKRVK
jgi:MarR family 2-MHQ and catechol resistance regulon transcriptional repressor